MIRFFIHRPIFAMVIAILMVLIGGICIFMLPVAQYPQIVPPQVQVSSQYIGAGSDVVSDTVTTPLELQINGVEGMIYMSSASTNNGNSVINITFDVGYNVDIGAVDTLTRSNMATPLLPATVTQGGVNIQKLSTNMVLVVNLLGDSKRYDEKFLGNYADINVTPVLSRVPGVGNVNNFGLLQYSIRIWLDPDKMTSMKLSPTEVISAIKEQNQQAPVGIVGQPPVMQSTPFQYQLSTLGQLIEPEQFANIILKTNVNGQIVRIRDVGRVEMGAQSYVTTSQFSGRPTASLGVYQLPGANAIQIANQVKAAMEKLSKNFPPGLHYTIAYDTTEFVKTSLMEVVKTLFEAIALVFLVVFVFLQSWRTTLIPCIAIPVSLIGTFALFLAFGFSINTLSLLGLVLAIGLVVDDAIVVVENVEKKRAHYKDIKEATLHATEEVRGPIIATTLILLAVFVPVAFIPGMTGSLYNQFALAIAFSVGLSGINSLTLSPALCGLLLKHQAVTTQHAFFKWFNQGYDSLLGRYEKTVRACVLAPKRVLIGFGVCIVLALVVFRGLSTGFIPDEDQGYFMVVVKEPNAASLYRTEETVSKVVQFLLKTKGVSSVISINGYNIIDSINQPDTAVLFVILDPWDKRASRELSVEGLMWRTQYYVAQFPEALIAVMNAPAIPGLGSVGGFQFEIEDQSNVGMTVLSKSVDQLLEAAHKRPELQSLFSNLDMNVPGWYLDIDRTKAKALRVSISDLFLTLQTYIGSYYVNNFTKYHHIYRVMVQADRGARERAEDITKLYVRSETGEMVPLGGLVKLKEIAGAFNIPHYNLYPAASITGAPAAGYSSGQALAAVEEIAQQTLPDGVGFEWTGITYQQLKAGRLASLIFILCLTFVFLFLAALYESWSMPFMILLVVPLALLGAGLALWVRKLSLDIYAQIGLILLIGLAAKNAILIVEFAKDKHDAGMDIVEAAVEAATLRLRPILMTAFAFILGVVPLVFAEGAGAASRHSIGTTVMGGMLCATLLSLLVVPVFYVLIQSWRERAK